MDGGERTKEMLRRGWEFLGRLARKRKYHADEDRGPKGTPAGRQREHTGAASGGRVSAAGELARERTTASRPSSGADTDANAEAAARMTRSLRELLEDLQDASPRVRGEAAKELGKRGGPGVEGALEPLLEDADEGVRESAVRALRDLGSEEAVRVLREALKSGAWEKRTAAAEALRELGWRAEHSEEGALYRILNGDWEGAAELGRHALPALVALMRSCSDEALRERAVRALGCMREPSTLKVMVEALHDIHPLVRKAAAWSLGQTGRRKAVEPLIAALGDPDEEVRREAAEALVRIGTPAMQPLVSALKEGDAEVRERVAEVIGRFYSSPDTEPLVHAFVLSALKDGDAWSRSRMATLLGEIGEGWAVKPLIEALYYFNVREAAGKAILKIGGPALGPLMAALRHHHIPIRKAAAELLGRMGDPRAMSALQSALKDRDWEVREAARAALNSIRGKDSGDERALPDRTGLEA